ncbi:Flp pilus assembly complex ATPase component TadA [bacterium]|nr:MAG: Flp pilus assembly complex ATPase component TadA [bacterium]
MGSFLSNTPAELNRSLTDQKRKIEEAQTQRVAATHHLQYLNMQSFPLDLNSLALITKEQAVAAECLPFYKEGKDLKIATTNPDNQLFGEIKKQLSEKYKITVFFVSKTSFKDTLQFYEKVVTPTSKFQEVIHVQTGADYLKQLLEIEKEVSNTSKTLEVIFGGAVQQGSSDIHIEPEDHLLKVRYRVDGVLHDAVLLPKVFQKPIISRIKLMAKLKLNVENEAQDGRITIMNGKEEMDVRVSSLPSTFGEALVMRLLGVGAVDLEIEQLGLRGKSLEVIETQLNKPNGMIITTGPTGSGKTTTLYSFLKELNEPGVKIITLEDPVEYKVQGYSRLRLTTVLISVFLKHCELYCARTPM